MGYFVWMTILYLAAARNHKCDTGYVLCGFKEPSSCSCSSSAFVIEAHSSQQLEWIEVRWNMDDFDKLVR